MADVTVKILTPATSLALISLDELKIALGMPAGAGATDDATAMADRRQLGGDRDAVQSRVRQGEGERDVARSRQSPACT